MTVTYPRYDANDLTVLEGLEAVRKRPGMYIGSTDSRGLIHCAWEIIDNAVDEAIAGHCSRIEVILHPDASVEVRDNGRGIPVDIEKRSGLSGIELIFTKLHAGGKFGGGGYGVSGGLHGVGASVVNALAWRLDAEVDRGGATHHISFHRGAPGTFDAKGKFTPSTAGPTKGSKATGTGTRVRYWADTQIFLPTATIDLALTHARARQTAFLVPGLEIEVTDARGETPAVEMFRYDGGVVDFVEYLADDRPVCDTIHIQGSGTFTESVPVLEGDHQVIRDVERNLGVDIALRWGVGYETSTTAFTNIIANPKGGTHVTGFERALNKTLNEVLRSTKLLKISDDSVIKEDVQEGMCAVVTVRLAEPQFEGQTKEILGTAAAAGIVAQVVSEQLKEWFGAARNKSQARRVLEKIAQAAKTRKAMRLQKETIRRKNALETSSMPAKLADCRSDDMELCELFLIEGDSAGGTLKGARNSEYQALLPLRGKILNVERATEKQMLDNAECAAIITTMGAGSGKSFDLESIRYGKLILLSVDKDEPVLITDAAGRLSLRRIGPTVDAWVDGDGFGANGHGTTSFDQPGLRPTLSPLKQVIRHHYEGEMHRLTTAYGRSVSVTSGHSVFTWRDGVLGLAPADELRVGDHLIAPRQLPRPTTPTVEIDVLTLLRSTGEDASVRIEAQELRHNAIERACTVRGAYDPNVRRVQATAASWSHLISVRQAAGLTQHHVAESIGYRQASSVSAWERRAELPDEATFRAYLALLGESWPPGTTFKQSRRERLESLGASGNDRYRTTSVAAWLSELTEDQVSSLGRDAVLYSRAHRSGKVARILAVDEDLCEFLGWFAAEGTLSGAQIRLALGADDEPQISRLAAMVERLFGATARIYTSQNSLNNRQFWFHAPLLANILRALGLGGRSYDKRLPDVLLNVDESCQLAFLAGIHLGDGTKGVSDTALVVTTTSSKDLADGISYLLGQLGVVTSTGVRAEGNHLSPRPQYILNVCGRDQVRRLRRVWRDAPNAELRRAELSGGLWELGLSRAVPISDTLIGLPITTIETYTVDEDVYDLSVADDESFVAGGGGGIMCHNTDADVDGSHIRCLLLTLCWRYMRPLMEAGRVYSAVPPLHRIELSGTREHIYTYTEAEMLAKVAEIDMAGKKIREMQRYKGLGEMDADQLAETTVDIDKRLLRRMTADDGEAASAAFEMLMGTNVPARRNFIVENALLDTLVLDI